MCKMRFCVVVFYLIILCLQFHKSSASHRMIELLKFDSEDKAPLNNNSIGDFKLIIPKYCKDLNICEYIPGYPQEYVDTLLRKLINIFFVFSEDVKQLEISSGDGIEREELCYSKQKVFFPQAARTNNNTWHLIVSSSVYPQTFIGEVCRSNVNEKSNCSTAIFLMNYYGKCVQKYIKKKMIGLNEEMDTVISLLVDVPSCCSCNLFRI